MSIAATPIELVIAGLALIALVFGLAAVLRGRGGGDTRLDVIEAGQLRLERALREEMAQSRQEAGAGLQAFGDVLERRFDRLAADSAAKLEEMRRTVDEKLQGTLEARLGESFRQVSERLEAVHRGLGEMQSLAAGVGDLKRVLGNVKARGIWGEMQLDALLGQILTPEQFLTNVATKPGSAERVEFAIRLPGHDKDMEVLLPIDAKFPREDYERLLDAADRADAEAVESAAKALENRLKAFARDIRDKYLNPPQTTDFAIMFLPTEGLYAEALRRPGLVDLLQRDFRVIPAGPTTIAALLNSLQMGFRTLAIEQRSSEVWQLLGAVKTEFARYGEVLDKVQKKLVEASSQIDKVAVRRRAIDRQLRQVEGLDPVAAARLIDLEIADSGSEED
ncbi:DNA recombination protein RmuC [Zavarzinia sp.]|uniref:DNA recombination protein RmuC n=1 Tax=Zavarzinia sp. TaxID=2027920 RepID=UPI003BB7E363